MPDQLNLNIEVPDGRGLAILRIITNELGYESLSDEITRVQFLKNEVMNWLESLHNQGRTKGALKLAKQTELDLIKIDTYFR